MIGVREFAAEFTRRFGVGPRVFSAPGRVNLIGEHTDYNEGFVLPFAIDKRTYVAVARRDDRIIRAHTLTLEKTAEINLDAENDGEGWTKYVVGMASVLREQGLFDAGADLLIDSEVPFGAGLSSSAALEVSLGLALAYASGVDIDRRDLAFAGQRVEHDYAGVRSGIMDQFASALAKKDRALLIDCRSNEIEHVPLELGDTLLIICDTRIKHSLASSEYNKRRAECEEGVRLLSEMIDDVTSLRDVSFEEFEEHKDGLPEVIAKRCRHVITENERTLAAVDALRRGELRELGRLMYRSHESLRDDYEVSCAELDHLVETARPIAGVLGARMTGGGFGGCTINLVRSNVYESFATLVSSAYRERFEREPAISVVKPSAGARAEELF